MKTDPDSQTPRGGAFTRDVFSVFGTQIIVLLGAAVTSIALARMLGPSGKGIMAIAMLAPQLIALAGGLGVNIANTYFAGRSEYPDRFLVGNSLLVSLVTGIPLTAVFLLWVPTFSGMFFKDPSVHYLYWTLPLVTFLLINENLSYLLLGHRKMMQFNFTKIWQAFSYLIFLIVLLYAMNEKIMGAIFANILSVTATVAVALTFMKKNGYGLSVSYHASLFRESLKFGLKGHLGTIFQYLNYRMDLLIVAYFLTVSSVGHYEVAVLVAETIWYIPNSISQILFPKIAASDKAEADQFTPIVLRHTFYWTVLSSLVLFAISGPLIQFLFTAAFSPSILALQLLLPGIVALSIWKVLINDLTGRGYPQYRTYSTVVSLFLTIGLDFLLIPSWGIKGAAVATSVAYGVSSLLSLYWFIRLSGAGLRDLFVLRMEDLRYYGEMIRSFSVGK